MASTLASDAVVLAGAGLPPTFSPAIGGIIIDAADAKIIRYFGMHPPAPVDPANPTTAELPNVRERAERLEILCTIVKRRSIYSGYLAVNTQGASSSQNSLTMSEEEILSRFRPPNYLFARSD